MLERCNQYENGLFYVSDTKMFCSKCHISLNYRRKDTISKHLGSKKHKINIIENENLGRNQTLPDFMKHSEVKSENSQFYFDLVKPFASANIPLHKLENNEFKCFLQKYTKVSSIPTSRYLRQNVFPKVFDIHILELQSLLENTKYISIVVDETKNRLGMHFECIICSSYIRAKKHKILSCKYYRFRRSKLPNSR